MESGFSIQSIGVILSSEVELHLCIWSINQLIGVKILGFQSVIHPEQVGGINLQWFISITHAK